MTHTQHWETLDAYLHHASTPIDYVNVPARDAGKDAEHCGTETFFEAIALARTGWPEGSRLVRQQADRFRVNVQRSQGIASGRIIRSSVVGIAPNIPAYIAQRPDSMLAFHNAPKNAPIVRILVSIGATWDVSSQSMTRRGAAVCALIDLLESSGRRVEITMLSAVLGNVGRLSAVYTVTLKRAQDALDLDRIAFALANPAMLRHITFAARDRAPLQTRREIGCGEFGGSMGTSTDAPADMRSQYNLYVGPIVNLSDSAAERWLIQQLRAQGVIE